MKKKFRGIILGVVAGLLLPIAVTLGAQEIILSSSSSSFSLSAVITFFNSRKDETVLKVKKEVENPDPNNPAPADDEFEFYLKLKGAVVQGRQYFLYNADGERIYNYEDGQTTVEDPSKFEVALKTDSYGMFTLLAGQTAEFSGLDPGDFYEVTEGETTIDYIQTNPPAGESAVGTLTSEGVTEVFTNVYRTSRPGTLEVRKNISYPSGYELPETPDFRFAVTVDHKPLKEAPYTIKNIKTKVKIGTGTTDANGEFTLKGDTFAVFENLPVDVDYSVREILDEAVTAAGWRPTGATVQEGATEETGAIAAFSNVLASFAVSKDMYGGETAEGDFGFQVLNGEGKGFGQKLTYYLYDENLQLVEEEGIEQPLQTAEDGSFRMKAGQRAVFVGLEKGTVYGVRETDSGRYVQFLPKSGEGYTGKVVTDTVEVLPFTNAVIHEPPTDTLLTVRKEVQDESIQRNMPDVKFTFQISKLDSSGEYKPLAKAAYDVVDITGTRTLTTDNNGYFTLRAWEMARFTKLKKNETYKVEEPEGKLPDGFVVYEDPEDPVYATEHSGTLGDDILSWKFKNIYTDEEDLLESGGRGTRIFYTVGAVLIVGAAVLLILRRRKTGNK